MMFLDKFLHDTELPVLEDAGGGSRDDALSWANTQYDAFAERRRLEAEEKAERRYIDDLRRSAETIEAIKKTVPKKRHSRPKKG